ncbi:hypothetical protein DFH07DRAFT_857419 [Mycena maculata]|uniref:TPX2 C-terminal domain-containing protein n=1 Tax=Mycena maculata TaxID=230809 RepID=A0AAD7MKW3_9AGAR|nr:hypothetical protein DFH07DRAFT_857419 [Mycena maculata]
MHPPAQRSSSAAAGATERSKKSKASTLNATVPRQFSFEAETGDPEWRGLGQGVQYSRLQGHACGVGYTGRASPTVPVPIAFSTDARAKERERFDEKVREKERERAATREVQQREREVEEAKKVRELRNRAIPKAHKVPEKNNGTGTTGAQ